MRHIMIIRERGGKYLVAFALVLALAGTGCATCCHTAAAWQYKMVSANAGSDAEKQIQFLATQGWYLISVSVVSDRGVGQPDTAFLTFRKLR